MEIVEYLDVKGASPFGAWIDRLDPQAAAKVAVAPARLELGNLSNTKGVGAGVLENKIEFGPGYRVYFGRDGATLVILLAGGTKRRQHDDIRAAQDRWSDYKTRKEAGRGSDSKLQRNDKGARRTRPGVPRRPPDRGG